MKKRRNADDRLRRLERVAFQTYDKEDILAYWRACVQAGIAPKPTYTDTQNRPNWALENSVHNAYPEVFENNGKYLYFTYREPRGWRYVDSLQHGLKLLLAEVDEHGWEHNPPVSISHTQRAYQRSPSGLWRGEIKIYASLGGKKRVGKLYMDCGNIVAAGQPVATISWVEVEPDLRRQGIATALYKAAAQIACDRGYVLASDVQLREGSRGFWRKQQQRGHATLFRDTLGDKVRLRYALRCPPEIA